MTTIVEPKQYIVKLWGKQSVKKNETFRLMRYVIRVDHNDKVLLHNVVTGQLVVLTEEEARMLKNIPIKYYSSLEQLVADHYLVPEDYDEHQQVIKLRKLLQRLEEDQRYDGVTVYTILTTTACNARCYYCFEKDRKITVMSEKTADQIVGFIKNHCGNEKKVFLTWFGGEPTLEAKRIDQICLGLRKSGILFQSKLVTNGYLLDEKTVAKAKHIWNLEYVQVSFDGTEDKYNKVKSYVGVQDNPYQHVMRNVGLLVKAEIRVRLRMNFDVGNYMDFESFVKEIKERFQDNHLIEVSAHPIIGEFSDHNGAILHGNDKWFKEQIVEMDKIAFDAGLYRKRIMLPSLKYRTCMAANDYSLTITPEGELVKCPERFDSKQIIGNVTDGIWNKELIRDWKIMADNEHCINCPLFPECIVPKNCATNNKCYHYQTNINLYSETAIKQLARRKGLQ